MKTRRIIELSLALSLFLTGGVAYAQEGQEGDDAPVPLPAMPTPFAEDPVAELKQLFLDVERQLKAIDIDLADAGAGEVPLEEVGNSGLDELLRTSRQKSLDAQLKIDRILEIAQEMGQSGSGSGKGKPSPGGDSPSRCISPSSIPTRQSAPLAAPALPLAPPTGRPTWQQAIAIVK